MPGKPFQPSLIFAGNAGAYLSEAPFRSSTLGYDPALNSKHYTRLEKLVTDKHSSLLGKFVNYDCKFYNIWPKYRDNPNC